MPSSATDNVYHGTISIWCNLEGGGNAFALKCLKRYEEQLGFERTSRFAMKVARDVPNCTIKTFPRA